MCGSDVLANLCVEAMGCWKFSFLIEDKTLQIEEMNFWIIALRHHSKINELLIQQPRLKLPIIIIHQIVAEKPMLLNSMINLSGFVIFMLIKFIISLFRS